MINYVHEYFKSVNEAYSLGNIETSYNAPIMALMERFGCKTRDLSGGRSGKAGENPDIKIWRGGDEITETEPFAIVEVKKIGGIDARAKAQVKKGASLFGYAILTDNRRWEFWRAGESEMYSGVQLMELVDEGKKLVLNESKIELFTSLMQDFLLQDPAQIRSSKKLAEYMAIHARTIRAVIVGILKEDEKGIPILDERQKRLPLFPELYSLFSRIKKELRPLLNTRNFADMYAQTIVYGLFIARYNDATTSNFNRYEAISKLQEESALLNRFFEHITNTGTKHPTLDAVIDKLCALYQVCNISELLDENKRGDTIVHFYEDFLTYYDPALRKSLGVFYTPHQVVRYLVSMVDKLLVEDFGIKGGLSNNEQLQIKVPSETYHVGKSKNKTSNTKEITVPRVAILDPATGTGTFHAEIIKYVKEIYFSGGRETFYENYIKSENGLLSRMVGFEIMMTSYAIAHLNVRRTIAETLGFVPDVQIPTNIFLTNTLSPPHSSLERVGELEQMGMFDFSSAIADEAYKADTWKTRRPIKVIIGNPPYLAASTNPYNIEAYKTEVDGITKLNEKNPKWLGDDYVKFFRFAEQIIENNNEGILAFISNNGFLSNPTFRGMRASLLRTFDKIYVVDLHGNAKKKEITPDGNKDENIFDIMQGVSLFIGIKKSKNPNWAKVYHSDLWGSRDGKFIYLKNADISYSELNIDPQMAYLFSFGNTDSESYMKGVALSELFPINVVGIVTARDALCIQKSQADIKSVLNDFQTKDIKELRIQYELGKDVRDWSVEGAKKDVEARNGTIVQIAYRPFDNRFTYYTGRSKGFHCMPRGEVMKHMLVDHESTIDENIGIVFTRGDSTPNEFSMIFIAKALIDNRITAAQTAGIASIAPLYLKPEGLQTEWRPNFSPEVLAQLTAHLPTQPTPIEIFDYIYGILHDPIYRQRFNEYLKRDFPRVPIINAPKENDDDFIVTISMFHTYITAGERLRKLHLLQDKIPASIAFEPPTSTNLEIGAIKYKDEILQLNPNTQITGIPADVWAYRIGGYQVLDKWFKSHKGKTLTIDDFDHICNVVGLLGETIKIQENLKQLH